MNEAAVLIGGTLMLAYPLAALHWYGYRSWKKTTATIIRYEDQADPEAGAGIRRAAVFTFDTVDGKRIEAIDPVFTHSKCPVGSIVQIVYPPESPQHARLASNLYIMQLFLGTFGLLVLAISVMAES